MDSRHIEELLERYWACETTLEEEAMLRRFFCEEDVPSSLLPYRDLFVYQQTQSEAHLSADFDARILEKIEQAPVVKARRVTLFTRLMPMLKAAAAIALLLLLGNLLEHSFSVGQQDIIPSDTIGNQISAPSVALSEENVKVEKLATDSLDVVKVLDKEELNNN